MILIPSEAIWNKLNSFRWGAWFDRVNSGSEIALITKLPSHIIKAIHAKAPIFLLCSVIETKEVRVRCVGVQITDDYQHPFCIFHACTDYTEQQLIDELLEGNEFYFHCFDERSRHVFGSSSRISVVEAVSAIDLIKTSGPHYVGTSSILRESSLDIFQRDLDASLHGAQTAALFKSALPLILSNPTPNRTFEYGLGESKVDDPDEGGGFEQSVHGSLKRLYPNTTFRSPLVVYGNTRRELTDLLAFDASGFILVEAKAMAVLSVKQQRSAIRRTHSIEKQIIKAIQQLGGATTKFRANEKLIDGQNRKIATPLPKSKPAHCIVLISEMYHLLNWSYLADRLVSASDVSIDLYFQVLDFAEFNYIVTLSRRPAIFVQNLTVRWEAMARTRNAYVRGVHPPIA